jgi:hypothetical protein
MVLSQTTDGDLCRSSRWREIYEPHGVADEVRVTLAADGYTWVFPDLTRDRGSAHFTDEEASFLRSLGPVMARGLRTALTAVTPSTQEASWARAPCSSTNAA